MSTPRHQRGTALLISLLVLAIAAAAAAAMAERQDLAQRSLESERGYEQARWLLRGGLHWARSILAEDARSGAQDHRRELWAAGLPPTDVELGSLAGEIRDEQALFNVNNLLRDGKVNPPQVAALGRLLAALGRRATLADAIAAAMEKSGPLADIAQLSEVRGMDPDALAQLARYATALPRPTPVNVNTAAAEVLVAVVEGLTLPEARVLSRGLAAGPARRDEEFRARLRKGLSFNAEDVSLGSQFFLVLGRAQVGRSKLQMQALLQRRGTALPAIVWQRAS
jgi:general secretion pathway protein K